MDLLVYVKCIHVSHRQQISVFAPGIISKFVGHLSDGSFDLLLKRSLLSDTAMLDSIHCRHICAPALPRTFLATGCHDKITRYSTPNKWCCCTSDSSAAALLHATMP